MAEGSPAMTRPPAAPVDEVELYRQQLDDLRGDLSRDVDELRSRVRATFDLRQQIVKHPFVATAVALGGILVVAAVLKSLRRGPRDPAPVLSALARRARADMEVSRGRRT